MKYLSIFSIALLCIAFGCKKSNAESTNTDLFEGKKLEGKWMPVTTIVMLRYDDGSVQKDTIAGNADEYLDFKYEKKTGSKSEGTFTTFGFGVLSTGIWSLQQDKSDLDLTYTALTPNLFLFRKVDALDEKKLIMTADDTMVKRYYEVNNLNAGAIKKVIGGSIFEEYKRV